MPKMNGFCFSARIQINNVYLTPLIVILNLTERVSERRVFIERCNFLAKTCNLIGVSLGVLRSSSKPVRFGVALPFSNDNKENNQPHDYGSDASDYVDGDGPILYRDDGSEYDG